MATMSLAKVGRDWGEAQRSPWGSARSGFGFPHQPGHRCPPRSREPARSLMQLRRFGLGANTGYVQAIAANHRRKELVRVHSLRVVRIYGIGDIVWSRAKNERLASRDGVAKIKRRNSVGVKAGIGERREVYWGDRRIGITRREGMDDPSLAKIAIFTVTVELRVFEIGVEFGEDLGDKDYIIGNIAGALVRDREGGWIAPNMTAPTMFREAVSTMDTVPAVWLAT